MTQALLGLGDQPAVGGKQGIRALTVLRSAQKFARTAQFQVLPGDLKAVVRGAQDGQALVGLGHQEAPAFLRAAAHAPAQLMQL